MRNLKLVSTVGDLWECGYKKKPKLRYAFLEDRRLIYIDKDKDFSLKYIFILSQNQ